MRASEKGSNVFVGILILEIRISNSQKKKKKKITETFYDFEFWQIRPVIWIRMLISMPHMQVSFSLSFV